MQTTQHVQSEGVGHGCHVKLVMSVIPVIVWESLPFQPIPIKQCLISSIFSWEEDEKSNSLPSSWMSSIASLFFKIGRWHGRCKPSSAAAIVLAQCSCRKGIPERIFCVFQENNRLSHRWIFMNFFIVVYYVRLFFFSKIDLLVPKASKLFEV